MNKIINIIMIVECIITALLYSFAIYTLYTQLSWLMVLRSILCLLIGTAIILIFLTRTLHFDSNKIYGFKYEIFVLGFLLQLAAFVLLKNRMV